MFDTQEILEINIIELLNKVDNLCNDGFRLVQICATTLKTGEVELNYSFDKNYKLINLRAIVNKNSDIHSITHIYLGAFLYENEIVELFGLNIRNIAIDFKGNLYKKSIPHPFNPANS
ncbi:MAG: hypothetical protein A2086_04130 [Spirochaetes bacterium GWD1_27_9]|nr:MAG: hypothetical protein A2Z98_06465 [Spirochaetes bacterium GWB1_27_13]OHD27539.1 MAG: hypothetical protein A2Y34_13785 [Spirochaetes bacterium GWC1_27_15]OHD44734.1 MAG: hypothetical protein A2086_04130 [Spirochaetes bacterium GWD1_27_9]